MKANLFARYFPAMALVAGSATAGPFGVDTENFSLANYGCKSVGSPTFYECPDVPNKHPDIDSYIVQYADGVGVCMVKGISVDIRDSVFGDNTMSKIEKIKIQLSSKYGEGSDIRYLRSGSIWNEPEDWMMGLVKDERTFATEWEFSTPIDGSSIIFLAAKASNRETGYFVVEFYKADHERCDEASDADAANAF